MRKKQIRKKGSTVQLSTHAAGFYTIINGELKDRETQIWFLHVYEMAVSIFNLNIKRKCPWTLTDFFQKIYTYLVDNWEREMTKKGLLEHYLAQKGQAHLMLNVNYDNLEKITEELINKHIRPNEDILIFRYEK